MPLSRQDEELAMASVALYRAAQDHLHTQCWGTVAGKDFDGVPGKLTGEEFANWCIKYACKSLWEWEEHDAADTQTIAIFVYTVLHLDQGKLPT